MSPCPTRIVTVSCCLDRPPRRHTQQLPSLDSRLAPSSLSVHAAHSAAVRHLRRFDRVPSRLPLCALALPASHIPPTAPPDSSAPTATSCAAYLVYATCLPVRSLLRQDGPNGPSSLLADSPQCVVDHTAFRSTPHSRLWTGYAYRSHRDACKSAKPPLTPFVRKLFRTELNSPRLSDW